MQSHLHRREDSMSPGSLPERKCTRGSASTRPTSSRQAGTPPPPPASREHQYRIVRNARVGEQEVTGRMNVSKEPGMGTARIAGYIPPTAGLRKPCPAHCSCPASTHAMANGTHDRSCHRSRACLLSKEPTPNVMHHMAETGEGTGMRGRQA